MQTREVNIRKNNRKQAMCRKETSIINVFTTNDSGVIQDYSGNLSTVEKEKHILMSLFMYIFVVIEPYVTF